MQLICKIKANYITLTHSKPTYAVEQKCINLNLHHPTIHYTYK